MSYLSKTHSVAEGRPIDLYQFTRGENEKIWRFCNADKDLEINGEKWLASAISDARDGGGDGNVTLRMPSNNPVARLYRGLPPMRMTTRSVLYGLARLRRRVARIYIPPILPPRHCLTPWIAQDCA